MSRGSEGASAELRDISTNLYSTHRWGFMSTHQDDYSAIHLLLFSISPPSPQQLKNGSIRGGGADMQKGVNTAHFLPRNNWHKKCVKLKLLKVEHDTPTINTSSKNWW